MDESRVRSFLVLPFLGLFCFSLSFNGFADNHQEFELKQLKCNIYFVIRTQPRVDKGNKRLD